MLAQYYVGNTLMDMGSLDDALKEYLAFTRANGGTRCCSGWYTSGWVICTTQGKQQEAIKSFEQSEVLNGAGVASLELARLYEAAGNEPEAQKKYKVVSEKLAGTPLGMEAAGKVRETESPVPGERQEG